MDARNAAEPDQTKPAGSPNQRQRRDSEAKRETDAPAPVASSPDKKRREGSADAPDDRDSDAETIVLPGKDGHSPSKVRKVRQEDKSDGDVEASKGATAESTGLRSDSESNGKGFKPATGHNDSDGKKKRPSDATDKSRDKSFAGKGIGAGPGPGSPQARRRRRSVDSYSSNSDSEHPTAGSSTKTSPRRKERSLPTKRKAPRTASDEEEEEEDTRKARRQRTTSNSMDTGRPSRERRASQSKSYVERPSVSPPPRSPRSHRRSASSQFASANGPVLKKKKKLPPPLNTADYLSDESSASGSPYPRHTKAKSLAASSNVDQTPAKKHKKHLDAHGQTLLARACARGEFEAAKQRLRERPEDLNVADFAGNTPLQIAAINGCEDIVELLIDAGCNVDCVNYDKDTPLLDAVDNGHLDVVKLLLNAGVNPRKANVNGEEPIDRLTEDTDNVDEIRAALIEAKKRFGGRTKTSEDRDHQHKSEASDSPRQSSMPTGTSRRGNNVRSQKTRNDLLYQPLDDKTLRQAAGRGDEEIVARILQVKGNVSDADPMVAAARGGHDLVIELLLGLGGADPDPNPISSQPSEFATPILAAIGQENFNVLELLIKQPQLDPTKRFKGQTYYEIARSRQGTNWKDEEQLLKDAYDARMNPDKPKTKSPSRQKEREDKRPRREERAESRPRKRDAHSPERDPEQRKKTSSKLGSPKAKRRTESQSHASDKERARKKEDRISLKQESDREHSPAVSQKQSKMRRNDSEVAVSSDGEAAKPRRKLISKGELRGEHRRRSSVHSNTSTAKDHPSSPTDTRNEDSNDRTKVSEKYHDRAKALKREESRDPGGEHSSKRHRTSLTPDGGHNGDKDDGEAPPKKRRLEAEGSEKRKKRPFDMESSTRKGDAHREESKSSNNGTKKADEDAKGAAAQESSSRNGSRRPSGSEPSIRIKDEDNDVDMPDAQPSKEEPDATQSESDKREAEERAEKEKAAAAEAALKKQEEAEKQAKQQKAEQEAADKRQREEEEKQRKAKEEAEKARKEEEEKKQAEELKAKQEAEDQARREEEEKKRREEEQRQMEEEEKKRREEEEERQRKEREAEEAQRKREEDERRERERQELERKRAAERRAREQQQEKARLEQLEKARLDKLPPLLRWLDTCSNPKRTDFAEKFATMQGVRYDTINPEANHTPEGREQWVLNTSAALLLGEKDLALTRYTDWDRVPASMLAKATIWRTEGRLYSLIASELWDLGYQLPELYIAENPMRMSHQARNALEQGSWQRFRDLDCFFIKLSDLMYTVPSITHLQDVKLTVTYRELLENEAQLNTFKGTQKWKGDPDANRFGGFFGPNRRFFVNGVQVGEDAPTVTRTSTTPFPEKPVPRRGLVQVFPSDPDYARLCVEQGLGHLVNGHTNASLQNGVHSPPTSHAEDVPSGPLGHDDSKLVNGVNGSPS